MTMAYSCKLNNYIWSRNFNNFELSLVFDNSLKKEFHIALFINGDDTAAITKSFDDIEDASRAFNEIVTAVRS